MESTNLTAPLPMLTRYDGENGVEILINTGTGESFCSISSYARMSGKAKSTISDRLATVRYGSIKTAEVASNTGFKTVRLIDEDLIVEWIPRDNPEAATALLKLGVRMGLHKMAGFEVASTAVPQTAPAPVDELGDIRAKAVIAIDIASTPGAADVFFALLNGTKPTPKHQAEAVKPAYRTPQEQGAVVKQRILAISRKKGGITARVARQGISKAVTMDATEIRTIFHQLAADGLGAVSGEGTATVFNAH